MYMASFQEFFSYTSACLLLHFIPCRPTMYRNSTPWKPWPWVISLVPVKQQHLFSWTRSSSTHAFLICPCHDLASFPLIQTQTRESKVNSGSCHETLRFQNGGTRLPPRFPQSHQAEKGLKRAFFPLCSSLLRAGHLTTRAAHRPQGI